MNYRSLIARLARLAHQERSETIEYQDLFDEAVAFQIENLATDEQLDDLANPHLQPSLRDLPDHQDLREDALDAVEADIQGALEERFKRAQGLE